MLAVVSAVMVVLTVPAAWTAEVFEGAIMAAEVELQVGTAAALGATGSVVATAVTVSHATKVAPVAPMCLARH